MLKLIVQMDEVYNEELEEFVFLDTHVLELEHSLVSLSKWEQTYEKAFLSNEEKSIEETFGYIRAMAFPKEVPDKVVENLNEDHMDQIGRYINSKMSATWFTESDKKGPQRSETITNEIIYYWMLSLNIPSSCETWHLNRLMTLIRVTNEKNSPPKKLSRAEIADRNRELNAKRRAQLNSKG